MFLWLLYFLALDTVIAKNVSIRLSKCESGSNWKQHGNPVMDSDRRKQQCSTANISNKTSGVRPWREKVRQENTQ